MTSMKTLKQICFENLNQKERRNFLNSFCVHNDLMQYQKWNLAARKIQGKFLAMSAQKSLDDHKTRRLSPINFSNLTKSIIVKKLRNFFDQALINYHAKDTIEVVHQLITKDLLKANVNDDVSHLQRQVKWMMINLSNAEYVQFIQKNLISNINHRIYYYEYTDLYIGYIEQLKLKATVNNGINTRRNHFDKLMSFYDSNYADVLVNNNELDLQVKFGYMDFLIHCLLNTVAVERRKNFNNNYYWRRYQEVIDKYHFIIWALPKLSRTQLVKIGDRIKKNWLSGGKTGILIF